jgi:2-keto-4-pentenoate hydratase/2-oxohepta-3-ene-1,7-dioic acid hydratase in catechol pathway
MTLHRTPWSFTDGRTMDVGTLYCIGRNYAAHAAEMGATVPTDPIVFLKPPAAIIAEGSVIQLPSWSSDVHHEVELVAVIGKDADNVSIDDALDCVAGYAVGLDLTARDIQAGAKQRGEPWAVAKSWRGSAPISRVVPRSISGDGPFVVSLDVNNVRRQHGRTSQMERSVATLVSFCSRVFTLRAGDAIFTGTPEGVARLNDGDHIVMTLDNLVQASFTSRSSP